MDKVIGRPCVWLSTLASLETIGDFFFLAFFFSFFLFFFFSHLSISMGRHNHGHHHHHHHGHHMGDLRERSFTFLLKTHSHPPKTAFADSKRIRVLAGCRVPNT